MDLKDKIQTLRLKQGSTLEEIGQKVGVSKTTVKRWESGEIANLRRDKIYKLAQALHTTPAYLMGWDDEKPLSISAEGRSEIESIFAQLSPSRQSKLLELARLYLDDQRKSGESK